MAQVIVKKWGNSLSVRLPFAIMQRASLNVNDPVEAGRIVIEPVPEKYYSLNELLGEVTNENINSEISFGGPIGDEAF